MKIKIYSFLVLSIIFLNSTSAQVSSHSPNRQINRSVKQQITGSPVHQFTSLWKQVDSLVNLGQPRSALDIVNKIYLQAKTENNDQQVIKAIIYRIRLNSDYQENFLTSTILELQNEIQIARQPAKQVLQSIIAEVYWKYYQNNQYRFRGRTQVKANITDSIETYDPGTIFRMITRSYMLSLNNADSLKRIPVGQFEAILDCDVFDDKKTEIQVAEAAKFIPTLYDFLADRALEFFTSNHQVYTIPVQHFEIDQEWYFDQTIDFTGKQMLFPADSAAPSSFAMRIFHDLATFHFKDKDPRALISVELKRFAFVNREYTLSGKDSLFINALWQFDQGQIGSPWGTSISYMLADYLNTCGQQYKPLVSSLHKWEIRSAAELCEKAIRRFPESEGANNCKILVKTIKSPTLRITTESAVPCEKPSLAMVEFKNINQLFFRMVKADPDSFNEKSGILDQSEFFKFLLSLPTIRSWSQNFPNDGDYQEHRTEISLPEVPNGFWVLMCAASKDFSDPKQVFSFIPFWSTQISYISKRNEDGSFGYFILDRETGMPLKNAKAEVWEKTYDYRERQYSAIKLQDYISDGQGFFLISPSDNNKRNSNLFLKIRYKEDFLITDNFYQYPVYAGQTKTSLQTMFYTDRAIYRPGQNVYFKGILLEKTGDKSKIKINHTTKVTFTDANGQKISEQTLTSNEFGSFNGSFSVPLGVLLGQMTISNESGSVGFSVEEYKRPTFEVACDQLEGNYRLGETITVTARAVAFAGNAIDGATVKYRVVRSASFPFWDRAWRRPMQASPQAEITSGNAFTDSTGKYSFTFKAIPDPTTDKETRPVFDFTIYADVTDINGETQSVQQTVSVGYNAMLIGINITEIVNLAKDSAFKISTTNLNGLSTPSIVTVTLQKLNQPDRSFISRSWECPDIAIMTRDEFYSRHPFNIYGNENDPETWTKGETIIEKTINTQTDSILKIEGSGYGIKLPGSYLLVLKATDPFGVVVEKKQFFTAFSPVSKEVPINTINWFVPMKTMGEPGENARFLIGSKEDNVQVIYEIRLHDSLVSREIIKLNDRAMVFEIPIREQYRGNFAVNFMFIKHNRAFQNSQLVNVPYTNKKLGIAFETFRNKLDPGSRESWKIRISGANEKPAHAEFLATMYDASLDQFRSNEWSFNLYQRYSGINPWDIDNSFRTSSGQWIVSNYGNENFSFQPALQLNWFGLNYFGRSGRYLRSSSGGMDKSSGMIMMERSPNAGIQASEMLPPSERNEVAPNVGDPAIVVDPANVSKGGRNAPKSQAGTAIKIRQNFQETAFFNPTIVTDSAGILILQFTAPESLTKWKMLGLAHTKNLDYGMIEKELITRKDLMVFPNTPRFVRQADTVIFSAKIVNLSDRELSGGVNLDLCDAITSQSLNSWIDTTWKYEMGTRNSGTRNQHFDAKTNQSVLVSWKLFIPISSNHSVLQLRITAVSGNFSDGEEKAIPILTNRMMVTESLPLPVRGKGTTEFSFDKLLKSDSPGQNIATLKNYRLTLEFASNPAWYAIQALPGLNDRKYENADAVFSAFWSNNIAAFIANSNPKIKAVFESWKKLTPDALKSNLSKNQELKTALLQETPWVMDATSEAERKQKLGLYFDLNNIEANLSENLVKLKKLQAPNGGWTWFAGMPENRWITQTIIAGMGHLDRLGVISIRKDPETWNMIVKGIRFLDSELIKDFESLKKQDSGFRNNNHLGATQIQYLYSRSYFMNDPRLLIPDPGEKFRESFNFYKKQAEKYWMHYDRYLQGMIALALNSLENKEVPALIIKSLSEKALHSNEMGMYWAGEPGFLWYQAPIETQALMIEVFDEIARDEKAVEDLKIWLLKQKQSQDWRSSRATLEACYSLLLRGTDLLSEEPGVKISIGREKINSDKLIDKDKEAGTGYFQVSWSGNQITSEMGRVSITKSTQGVAWGALYWQYFENLDKITPAATPMKLEKKLFVE
ncbi:MAG: alpha-2-macroglobulin family protein, partial [Bacteroidota bacterium]